MKKIPPQKLTAAEYVALAKTWTAETPVPSSPIVVKGRIDWNYGAFPYLPPATISGDFCAPKGLLDVPVGFEVKGRFELMGNPDIQSTHIKAKTISISSCPNLTSVAVDAESVSISGCPKLVTVNGGVIDLQVNDCAAYAGLSGTLGGVYTIRNCPSVQTVDHPVGSRMEIHRCAGLASLGAQFRMFPNGILSLSEVPLESLDIPLPSHTSISNCSYFKSITCPPTASLNLSDLPALDVIGTKSKKLSVTSCPKVTSFGDETTEELSITHSLHLTELHLHLRSLCVTDCPNFRGLGTTATVSSYYRLEACPQVTLLSQAEASMGILTVDSCVNFAGFADGTELADNCFIKNCPAVEWVNAITKTLTIESCENYRGLGPNGKIKGAYSIDKCPRLEIINHPVAETIRCWDTSFKGLGPLASGTTLYLKNSTISVAEYQQKAADRLV